MLDTETNQRIQASPLAAIDKLAARTAIATLELLQKIASDRGTSIDSLTTGEILEWFAVQ